MKKILALALCVLMTLSSATVAAAVTSTGDDQSISVEGYLIPGRTSSDVISVDVSWTSMDFIFCGGTIGTWNPGMLEYTDSTDPYWKNDTATISVTNHSNVNINSDFRFEKNETDATAQMFGTFSEDTILLPSADSDAYRTPVDGVYPAPKKDVTFTVGGEIQEDTELGTIVIVIYKRPDQLDLTGANYQQYNDIFTAYVTDSDTSITILFPSREMTHNEAFAIKSKLHNSNIKELKLLGATNIPTNSFSATTLKKISMPDVLTVESNAFATTNNESLVEEIELPAATTIGEGAFQGLKNLKKINIPEVTVLDNTAFYGCESLTSIEFEKVTTVKNGVFTDCKSLKTVSLPLAESIDTSAFNRCSALEEVYLPSVTTMGYQLFYNCTSLKVLSFKSVITSASAITFEGASCENADLYLNENQGDVDGWTTTFGANGTFLGKTFKEVIAATD